MRAKRSCQYCGKSDHMTRVVDAKAGVYDVRYRICYRCHPELDASSRLNGPDGGLKIMKSEHRDERWDYCEPIPKDTCSEDDEKYADDDTILDASEIA